MRSTIASEKTALAVTLLTGIPWWATITAGGMEAIQLPKEATNLIMMADKDRSYTGQKAAFNAGERLANEGRAVEVCVPVEPIPDEQKSLDWLDVYQARLTEAKELEGGHGQTTL